MVLPRALVIAALLLPLIAARADAATLVADYRFDDSLASSVGDPPALNNLGAGNAFATETVDGAPNRVLTFPAGNGLHLPPFPDSVGFYGQYSIVLDVRFTDLLGYRRLISWNHPLRNRQRPVR